MKPGQESQTAVMVAAGRAVAEGRTPVAAFHDPTAFALLPADAQRDVERIRSGTPPTGARERIKRTIVERRSQMMVVRTVAIDAAVRDSAAPQLVILGAGLDGRAWRMGELADATVYEVDHPDSQREKQARAAALPVKAREVRFVPVDFTTGDLDRALAAAGHDPAARTTWIWEGVVMYLTLPEIEATLRVIQQRSSPSSRLIVAYHAPAVLLKVLGFVVRRMGEPLRSAFNPDQMRALLARYGFATIADDDLPALARRLAPEIAAATRPVGHLRIVVAERA